MVHITVIVSDNLIEIYKFNLKKSIELISKFLEQVSFQAKQVCQQIFPKCIRLISSSGGKNRLHLNYSSEDELISLILRQVQMQIDSSPKRNIMFIG